MSVYVKMQKHVDTRAYIYIEIYIYIYIRKYIFVRACTQHDRKMVCRVQAYGQRPKLTTKMWDVIGSISIILDLKVRVRCGSKLGTAGSGDPFKIRKTHEAHLSQNILLSLSPL